MRFYQNPRTILIALLLSCFALLYPGVSQAQGKAYCIGPRDILSLTIYAGGE